VGERFCVAALHKCACSHIFDPNASKDSIPDFLNIGFLCPSGMVHDLFCECLCQVLHSVAFYWHNKFPLEVWSELAGHVNV
jgi:hypothetical protein